jgi:hypothetical protein
MTNNGTMSSHLALHTSDFGRRAPRISDLTPRTSNGPGVENLLFSFHARKHRMVPAKPGVTG